MSSRFLNRLVLASAVGAFALTGSSGVALAQGHGHGKNKDQQEDQQARKKQKQEEKAQQQAERQQQRQQRQAEQQAAQKERRHQQEAVQQQRQHQRQQAVEAQQAAQRERQQKHQAAIDARQAAQREQQRRHQESIDARQANQREMQRRHQQSIDERQAAQQAAVDARRSNRQVRLSEARQRQLIAEQQQRSARYAVLLQERQQRAAQLAADLRAQKRLNQYRFQQAYLDRLRRQQYEVEQARYYNYNQDPFFYSAPTYRYSYGGRAYETNQYGADLLRQALNNGYEEGYQAGQADRMDGWRADYRNSYAYQDANFGYNGMYVQQNDYNHYFRQGFQRGYEDGYYSRSQYGQVVNGKYQLLAGLLSTLLNLTNLR